MCKQRLLLRLAAIVLIAGAPCIQVALGAAVDEPPQSPTPAPAAAPKTPNLANWWQKSSLDFLTVNRTLVHTTANLSFMQADGNTSGHTVDVGGSVTARRHRLTNEFVADVNRRDITYGLGGGSADYHEHTFRNQLSFDMTRRAWLIAGIEHYTNTLYFMDKRLNVYGGIGSALYHTDRHRFDLIAALGHANFKFDKGGMLELGPRVAANVAKLDTMTPSSAGMLGMQSWRWVVSSRLTVNQDASFMEYFNPMLGRQLTLNLSGDIPVSKHVSIGPAYRIKREVNAYVSALQIKPTDRTLLFSFRVSM
jgi:hypothetical protein